LTDKVWRAEGELSLFKVSVSDTGAHAPKVSVTVNFTMVIPLESPEIVVLRLDAFEKLPVPETILHKLVNPEGDTEAFKDAGVVEQTLWSEPAFT